MDDPKEEVRLLVLQHLAGLALDEASALQMGQARLSGNRPLLACLQLMAVDVRQPPLLRQEAFNCLINLSSHPTVASSLQSVEACVGMICDEGGAFAERALMLLSNLSKLESGRTALWPHWDRMVAQVNGDEPYLASLLADLTADAWGRDWLWAKLGDRLYPLGVDRLADASLIRRGGALTALYNCLHDTGQHARLLAFEEGDEGAGRLVAQLGGRLACPQSQFDADDLDRMPLEISLESRHQPVESDLLLRLRVVECFLLLCSTWLGREHLRKQYIYPVLREWHKLETDEEIKQTTEKVVEMIIRDDCPEADTPEQ